MSKSVIYSGPSTLTLLGIVFITLKLLGYIQWSWFWVLAPFWIPVALLIIVFLFLLIGTGLWKK